MTSKPKAKPAAKQTAREPETLPIERTNPEGAWWCPFCDTSMESKLRQCTGCKAVRDGDEAVRD